MRVFILMFFLIKVTATLGSVQMIEQLTEQNLDLESKLGEMRETIADLVSNNLPDLYN